VQHFQRVSKLYSIGHVNLSTHVNMKPLLLLNPPMYLRLTIKTAVSLHASPAGIFQAGTYMELHSK